MKLLIILFFIIILIFFCIKNTEDFSPTDSKCCVISKKVNNNNKIIYNYKIDKCNKPNKLLNNNLDNDNYFILDINKNSPEYDPNSRKILPNEIINNKPFDLSNCNKNLSLDIGSCRVMGRFECVDFMTKPECKQYNMIWSNKKCSQDIPYKPHYPDNVVTT